MSTRIIDPSGFDPSVKLKPPKLRDCKEEKEDCLRECDKQHDDRIAQIVSIGVVWGLACAALINPVAIGLCELAMAFFTSSAYGINNQRYKDCRKCCYDSKARCDLNPSCGVAPSPFACEKWAYDSGRELS